MLRLSCILVFLSIVFAILLPPKESQNAYFSISNMKTGDPGHVLLLTAHPDDECMFFAPTITALVRKGASIPGIYGVVETKQKKSAAVYSLCLSIGDADSLGHIRKRELGRSLDILGIPKSNRWVLDHPNLKDNITSYWSPMIIAKVLTPYIIEHHITTILTFDEEGISGHPNHKSLREGAVHLLRGYNHPTLPPPRLFTLKTVPIMTKYTGVLAALLAKFDLYKPRLFYHVKHLLVESFVRLGLALPFSINDSNSNKEFTTLFISGASEYALAISAMQEHASQLVWFRYLYVIFSRYMWVNEWVEVRVMSS